MKSEQLQKWASVAEIIASIAVVLSLIYVAMEIDSNTRALQASTRQEFAALDIQLVATPLDPLTLATAIDKYSKGEDITSLEDSQLYRNQQIQIRVFENAFYQYNIGALRKSDWDRYQAYLSSRLCNNEHAIRVAESAFFPDDFAALMEEIMMSC